MTITLSYTETPAQIDADTELERLAEAALVADMEAKEAAEKQKAAKDAFKKALEARGQLNPDTKGIGVVRCIIKETKRFDKALAEQLLTPEEIQKYSSLDSAKVKENVAPTAYALMQKATGFSLETRVAD